MNKKYIKIFFIFLFLFINKNVFAANVRMNIHYGVENIAKFNDVIPITVDLINIDEEVFDGYINVNVYESNESLYRYRQNIQIEGRERLTKTIDVSISDTSNTIICDLFDLNDENIVSERLNIDLNTIQPSVVIGIISNNENKLNYFDDVSIYNNIRTKVINLKVEQFLQNRQILEHIDCLVISNIDFSVNSQDIDALNTAMYDFLNKGKSIILGTGELGDKSLPKFLRNKIIGPIFVRNDLVNLNGIWTEGVNIYEILNLPVTNLNFDNYIKKYNENIVEVYIENGIVSIANFDYCDISSIVSIDNIFIKNLLNETIDNNIIDNLSKTKTNFNRYNNIKKLVDVADVSNLPDILLIVLIISIYIIFITVITYSICINIKKKNQYQFFVILTSIVFLIAIMLIFNKNRRNKTYLSFVDITELDDDSSKETAILNFINIDNKKYSFATNMNNSLYPLVKNLTTPIYREEIEGNKDIKVVNIEIDDSEKLINAENIKEFDSNIFIYKNESDLNYKYPIDISLNFFDGNISGMIANNMDVDIMEASIIFLGKTLYVGTVKSGSVVILPRGRAFNSPIGNNTMQADLMCYFPNSNIVKYYLDNINNSYNRAKFVGFINENKTIDLYSYDISDIFGNTMIVKSFDVNYTDSNNIDMIIDNNRTLNLYGDFNIKNNSIDGDTEVINKYILDKNYNYSKIYFENLSDYDVGKSEYNVPFYGIISVYNYINDVYDEVTEQTINEISNYINDNNELIVRYTPTGKDFLSRKISLPLIRTIGQHK